MDEYLPPSITPTVAKGGMTIDSQAEEEEILRARVWQSQFPSERALDEKTIQAYVCKRARALQSQGLGPDKIRERLKILGTKYSVRDVRYGIARAGIPKRQEDLAEQSHKSADIGHSGDVRTITTEHKDNTMGISGAVTGSSGIFPLSYTLGKSGSNFVKSVGDCHAGTGASSEAASDFKLNTDMSYPASIYDTRIKVEMGTCKLNDDVVNRGVEESTSSSEVGPTTPVSCDTSSQQASGQMPASEVQKTPGSENGEEKQRQEQESNEMHPSAGMFSIFTNPRGTSRRKT